MMVSENGNIEYISTGCDLLGQVDYYKAIMNRRDLIAKEGEFRIKKLGLIVDLIKAVNVPDDLKTKLTSAIIDAWRLDSPDSSAEKRDEEMSYIMRSIEAIRGTVQWLKRHPEPQAAKMLDIAVIFAIPIMTSDLYANKVRHIHDLLGQAVENLSKSN
jgi:hypothetical protein